MMMYKSWSSAKEAFSVPFFVVLACCILVVLGSLRNIVSPLGYWLLWASAAVIGLLNAADELRAVVGQMQFKIVSIGFGLLCLGLLTAGVMNDDGYTLFQGFKFVFIYLMFVVLCCCSRKLSAVHLFSISKAAILVSFLFFIISKFFFNDLYIVLGDGREGSQFAFPGVLWKTATFFIGFALAGSVLVGRIKVVDGLIALLAVYLLLSDSSRTGFIWFLAVCIGLIQVNRHGLFKVSPWVLSCGAGSAAIVVVLVGYFDVPLFARLIQGDSVRTQMLIESVAHAKGCFVFGCGAGSSFSMVLGEPMVTHNAYLATLADLGVLGLVGLLMLTVVPLYSYFYSVGKNDRNSGDSILSFVTMLGVLGYGFLMMLHPLSSELSEWGIWALMVSWQFSCSSVHAADQTAKRAHG